MQGGPDTSPLNRLPGDTPEVQPFAGLLARPDGRVGSSLRELLAFVLAFARSYG